LEPERPTLVGQLRVLLDAFFSSQSDLPHLFPPIGYGSPYGAPQYGAPQYGSPQFGAAPQYSPSGYAYGGYQPVAPPAFSASPTQLSPSNHSYRTGVQNFGRPSVRLSVSLSVCQLSPGNHSYRTCAQDLGRPSVHLSVRLSLLSRSSCLRGTGPVCPPL
jgi:hypothetical protein